MEYLVLDEADRLLDLGFEPDVRWIIEKTSQTNRQTVMVSATWPQAVRSLASEFLSDPVLLRVGRGQNGGSLSFHAEEGMLQANQRVELNVEVCICAYLEMSHKTWGRLHQHKLFHRLYYSFSFPSWQFHTVFTPHWM